MESDGQLIEKIRAGHRNLFAELIEKYQDYAYRLAFRLLGEEEVSRDVVQNAFMKSYQKLSSFNPSYKFSTWLYRIVVNLSLDEIRRQKRQQYHYRQLNLMDRLTARRNPEDPEIKYSREEMVGLLRSLTGHLKPKQRVVFVLKDLNHLSLGEIREITGYGESLLKANLYHARKKLKTLIGNLPGME